MQRGSGSEFAGRSNPLPGRALHSNVPRGGEYDEIELPPIAPFVRRHHRLHVCCPQCRAGVKGALPAVANGSPFGPRLHALVLYLKTFQAISFARLEGMLDEVFGVRVSQGALANMLRRSQQPFEAAKLEIIDNLRQADMVASDETGIRIEGSNGYHWVFMSNRAVVHEAQHSRAAQVVRDILLSDAMHRLPGEAWAITARRSGSRMGTARNKSMDTTIKPALRTWLAISPMGSRTAPNICLST